MKMKKMNKKQILIPILLITALILGACSSGKASKSTKPLDGNKATTAATSGKKAETSNNVLATTAPSFKSGLALATETSSIPQNPANSEELIRSLMSGDVEPAAMIVLQQLYSHGLEADAAIIATHLADLKKAAASKDATAILTPEFQNLYSGIYQVMFTDNFFNNYMLKELGLFRARIEHERGYSSQLNSIAMQKTEEAGNDGKKVGFKVTLDLFKADGSKLSQQQELEGKLTMIKVGTQYKVDRLEINRSLLSGMNVEDLVRDPKAPLATTESGGMMQGIYNAEALWPKLELKTGDGSLIKGNKDWYIQNGNKNTNYKLTEGLVDDLTSQTNLSPGTELNLNFGQNMPYKVEVDQECYLKVTEDGQVRYLLQKLNPEVKTSSTKASFKLLPSDPSRGALKADGSRTVSMICRLRVYVTVDAHRQDRLDLLYSFKTDWSPTP